MQEVSHFLFKAEHLFWNEGCSIKASAIKNKLRRTSNFPALPFPSKYSESVKCNVEECVSKASLDYLIA